MAERGREEGSKGGRKVRFGGGVEEGGAVGKHREGTKNRFCRNSRHVAQLETPQEKNR